MISELEKPTENMILLHEKEVDYSLLNDGFGIPKKIVPKFIEIFGDVPVGQKKEIKCNIDGIIDNVDFRHINTSDIQYQILYGRNRKILKHLKIIFSEAFKILEDIRHKHEGNIRAKLPDNKKEYLLIYYNTTDKQLVLKKRDNINSFFPVIQKFIQQAEKRNNLKISGYPKKYEDLKVDVSFGKGIYARISFLYEGQKTSNGIYPIFLYYKEQKILILSYGISETNTSSLNWNLPENTLTIKSYFQQNNLGIPKRYGDSFIFKVYNVSKINGTELDKDLKEIISIYKNIIEGNEPIGKVAIYEPFKIQKVQEIKLTGLLFSDELLYRYALSLLTKPFVILSGLSGSGKTRLAMTFAKWLSRDDSQIKIVSVGSDWSNREYLLGYPNALECGKYIEPENGVLSFILEAKKYPTKPYFLILDEMNLSYVERYFADFLSAMESHECINLHPDSPEWLEKCKEIPSKIKLPPNLYITGTINVDETTYMFSPKVLDRANVIEFRISEEEMDEFLTHCKPLNPDVVNSKGSSMEVGFTTLSKDNHFEHKEEFNNILIAFFKELKLAGAEFGYRTASEIYRFITLAKKLDVDWDNDKLIDIVVMQKMLPKLHGSRKKIQPILIAIWKLCLKENASVMIENEDIVIDERFKYPLSATKIWQMYKNARDNGFTSYAEA